MTFLNPLVLLGLVAAAIPLIIHLFNFRRPRKVDFSSLTFLKELQKTTMQRVRVQQWLLLLLRALAIGCLALAFARPTLTGDLAGALGGKARSSIGLVIDNSLSMTHRDAHGEYLARAREIAAGVIGQMQPGDEITLMTTEETTPGEAVFYGSTAAALDAVKEIAPRPGSISLSRAVLRAADALSEADNLNREIYLISDMQRTALADSSSAGLPRDVRAYVLPVGGARQANVGITEVRITSRIVEENRPLRMQATLVNYGPELLEQYGASVFLGGQRMAQAAADLPPGQPTTVSFVLTPDQRGWLSGAVRLEDDAFEFDNTRFFTLHVPEQRKLLLIAGEGQRLDYLSLALTSGLSGDRSAFEVDTVPENGFTSRAIDGYDAVILAGPNHLTGAEIEALARYVEQGGGLLFFPSRRARTEDYSALFRQIGGGAWQGFTGDAAGPPMASFARVDYEHPLLEGVFEGAAGRGPTLESPDVYQAMQYIPAGGNEHTVIQLSNGFPFLQEIRHGEGVAFLVAVAPDPDWSDFPVRGLFIPLLYRSVYYLSSSESVSGEQLLAGRSGEIRIPGVAGRTTLRLISPQGVEITPEQRTLFGATLLQIDASVETPGVYDVRADDRLVRRIALNMDSGESDPKVYDLREAARRLSETTGLEVDPIETPSGPSAAETVEAIRQKRMGVEIWNVFLLMALIFMLAEMLVARRWKPEAVAV